ncbi:hypothetical protein [Streptomyces sp. NPDC006510]|uniref:hypothetical protein n=1 Tax=Streptomyces sp. NPDC006510 TaxID=3155600 RepID=UPI0033A8488B
MYIVPLERNDEGRTARYERSRTAEPRAGPPAAGPDNWPASAEHVAPFFVIVVNSLGTADKVSE